MARFRVKYGSEVEFEGQGAGEVVAFLQERHVTGSGESEGKFLRRLAIELCEWSGKYFCYDSRDRLADSMMRHGLLEVVD